MEKQKTKLSPKPAASQRSMSPAAGGSSGVRFSAQGHQTESNIFQHLAVFFACGAPAAGMAGTGGHVIGNADDTVLLPILLKDIAKRKCTFEKLVRDLDAYCKYKEKTDLKGQIFLGAVLKILWSMDIGELHWSNHCLQVIAQLVFHFSGALEDLLSEICGVDEQEQQARNSSQHRKNVLLCVLEIALRYAQYQEKNSFCSGDARFVNRVFSFGETPITFAARKRNYDAMKMLLRYGADVTTKWLNFRNTLEVLLFAPHVVFVSEEEMLSAVRCVSLVCAELGGTNVMKGLEEKESNGYFPLCSNWKELLPQHITESQGPCLKHLCQQVVRQTLLQTGSLPNGIVELPLPNLLKAYLDYEQL